MYDQIREDTLYIMLYAVVTAMAMMASCYLLFRDGNAFAAHIKSPIRLRRWTAAFFAVFVLNHLWYMLPSFFLTSSEDIKLTSLAGGLLDSITFFPLAIIVLLTMLQDRQRPLWPVWVMVMPLVAGMVWCVISQSDALLPILIGYLLLMSIGLTIYMVRALRQYGRWLRDNYADLEHKEVWQSFVVLAIILLVFGSYMLSENAPAYEYALQLVVIVLIGYLLWRVETLSDLSIPQEQDLPADLDNPDKDESNVSQNDLTANIEPLLQKYCIDTQLYLQHDLTLPQLAKAIGTNRFYLSQYFSNKEMNYNTYINDLRINHFVSLYREAVAANSHFTVQQLANDSGYRSYSTFNLAFKQRMGHTVNAWAKLQNQQ
jgi:AraC-like DNA-binding protein